MQGDDGHDEYSEAEEEGVYSEELSGSEAAEDEWWAQGGGGPRRWLLRRRLRRATPRRSRGAGGPVAEG
jgi:hypothetical protein|tara:strand:- start:161 stop:367 length:207 start_codon:yes stop_codon:yes gene_type:complete